MIRKILILAVFLISIFFTANSVLATVIKEYWCNPFYSEGRYYPRIEHRDTYYSSIRINHWKKHLVFRCNYKNVTRQVYNITCDSWYKKNGYRCIRINSNCYRYISLRGSYICDDYWYNNSYSCKSGSYKWYLYWNLNNGETTNSSKNISNGKSFVKIRCTSWNISREIIRLECRTWYWRSW